MIKDGQWETPFWGASKKFITGQDMLGMQNASIATYATLLPGLTNLTRRIRYYGFYMWLLEQYAKTEGKVSVSEFQRFMRRGELILAFVMTYNQTEELGIVGSLYARKKLQKDGDLIDIAAGADRDIDSDETYWQYSSGAFGQYYHGALTDIGLITQNEKAKRIDVCTPHYGRELANLFESTISVPAREKYLEVIKRGFVSREELFALGKEFSLTAIKPYSKEWEFYVEMLFGKDYPTIEALSGHTTFRLETLLLYMRYLANQKHFESTGSFPRSFHYRKWDTKPFIEYPAATGWHYYALNEFAHYILETILWAFLVDLNAQGPKPLPDLVKTFTENAHSALLEDLEIARNNAIINFKEFSKELYQIGFTPGFYTDEISQTSEDAPFEGYAHALKALALIYHHDKHRISDLQAYARKHGMYRSGDVTELLLWIQKNEHQDLHTFIKKLLLQHIISRHIEVAMRKMRNRNENTLKFILEDNIVRPMYIVEPVWTSPRIHSLHQFLVDLKLVEHNALTDLGRKLLEEKLQ